MENENFDEDLKNRIKQIFEDFDDGQANEGWNLLREKYPKKNNRKYFFWWIAAVLLITALLIWFFQPETDKTKSVKSMKQFKSDSAEMQVKVHSISKNLIIKIDSFSANHTKKVVVKTVSDFAFRSKNPQHKPLYVKSKPTEITLANQHNNTVFTDVKLSFADSTNHTTLVSKFTKADSLNAEKSQESVQAQNPNIKPLAKKEVVKTVSIKKAIPKTSKFGLSLFAGPHVNFANGSNILLGFGAGISTDFQLNKKLKLGTGLGLIRSRLLYPNAAVYNNTPASLPANQSSNLSSGTISNSATFNISSASLLQLDVPINLIYNILLGKNSISVLAGLSSGTFAKERYQYKYTNAASDSQSFQSFYLLKTLNIATQIGLPISKYNLQVEPFLKIPLGNIATQQLKFDAAGINLKINIKP